MEMTFFPLKTFGYLPFQPISDVTNIMFGISFACQSSELLPTVRKPGLPTLPHAKRCSIQVPPKLSLSLSFSVLENLQYSRDQLTLQAAKAAIAANANLMGYKIVPAFFGGGKNSSHMNVFCLQSFHTSVYAMDVSMNRALS